MYIYICVYARVLVLTFNPRLLLHNRLPRVRIFTGIYLYSPVCPPPTPRHTIFTNITRFYARVLNIWCVRRVPTSLDVSPFTRVFPAICIYKLLYCCFSSEEHRRRRFVTTVLSPPPHHSARRRDYHKTFCLFISGAGRKRYKRVTIVIDHRDNGRTAITCDNKFNAIRYPTRFDRFDI